MSNQLQAITIEKYFMTHSLKSNKFITNKNTSFDPVKKTSRKSPKVPASTYLCNLQKLPKSAGKYIKKLLLKIPTKITGAERHERRRQP